MAAPKKRTQLQKLFKSGAKPSEADFKDLIDGGLNISDDGIEKPAGADTPLKILTHGDQENVLDIYAGKTPTWRLNQKPTTDTQGLNLEIGKSSKLFLEGSTGNLGLGVTKPIAKLHIQQSDSQNALRIDDEVGDTTPLIVDAEGKVGIGTDTPNARLDVKGGMASTGNATINNAFLGDVGHGPNWAGFCHSSSISTAGYGLLLHNDGKSTLLNKKSGTGYIGFRIDNIDKMVIANSGYVGIGETTPDYPLHVKTGIVKNWQARFTNNNSNVYLAHADGHGLHINTGGTSSSQRYGLEVRNKTHTHLYVREDGKVGIGTRSPHATLAVSGTLSVSQTSTLTGHVGIGKANTQKGVLEVHSWTGYEFAAPKGLDSSGISNGYKGKGTWGSAIYAYGKIVTQAAFLVASDMRTKNIIGQSNSKQDLETLKKIEIIDYKLKGTKTVANHTYKKVIGQQVRNVYPKAVSLSIDEVPDIYQNAQIKNGWVVLATNLKKGERVQLIYGKETKVFEVLESEENGFKVETDWSGKVFVRGREVNDFHTVDYEAISMLNVSATQELSKRIEALQKANNQKDIEISALRSQLEEQQGSFNKRLAAIESTKVIHSPENRPVVH